MVGSAPGWRRRLDRQRSKWSSSTPVACNQDRTIVDLPNKSRWTSPQQAGTEAEDRRGATSEGPQPAGPGRWQ